jgi:tRNA pseudouridine55 synthase
VTPAGLLVLDKPAGMTSHDVVAVVRRLLGNRKVGHAGTLDPMATGVLLVGVGPATRLLGHLALAGKSYRATIRLGSSTVTDDREGAVTSVADAAHLAVVTDEQVRAALAAMVGTIEQRPSAVSAVKVDGRRAYDRVRAGEEVDLPARSVTIEHIDILGMRRESSAIDVDVDVACSTGTYIRAIARDVGEALGLGGHLVALRRTRVGPFDVASATSLDSIALDGAAVDALLPMSTVASRTFPTWQVAPDVARAVSLGQRVPWAGPSHPDGPVAIVDQTGALLALATRDDGLARYQAVFAAPESTQDRQA